MSGHSTLALPIRDAVHAALRARAVLHDVAILKREPKQLASEIEAAIAQLKLCMFVFPALCTRPNPNNPGPYFERIEVRVRCIENPLLNDTVLDGYQLVELGHWLLNGLRPNIRGVQALSPSSPVATEEVTDEQNVIHDLIYETSGGLEPRPDSP